MKLVLTLEVDVPIENRTGRPDSEIERQVLLASIQEQGMFKEKLKTIATNYLLYGEDRSDLVPGYDAIPDALEPSQR